MSGKNIFILGAGFSAYAGIPLMNNFIQKARDYYFELFKNEQKYADKINTCNKVDNYIDRLSKVRSYLNVDLHNIETLYSLIEMESYLGNVEKRLISDFKKYISYIIEYSTPDFLKATGANNIKDIFEFYSNFLSSTMGNSLYITFNYDLLIENSIASTNKSGKVNTLNYVGNISKTLNINNPDKTYLDITNGDFVSSARTCNLIKLHGSLNWEYSNKKEIAIIPPSWKKGNDKAFDQVWRQSYYELEEAKNIVFIGYSLPETDSYFKNLLTLALSKNKKLKKVIVINPDNSGATEKRYTNLIDNTFLENRNGLDYKDMYFAKQSRKYTINVIDELLSSIR
jgi:hypothetical protein